MMPTGLLSLGDLTTDAITGVRPTPAARHRSLVEQAVLAEQVGFDSVHLGEHHFCEYILSAPQIVLGAIAERTTNLRLSTGVTLGANLDPLRVAEDYATVDLLSGGRVEPVIGRGSYFPHVFDAFGQDARLARSMFAEHVELLCNVWSNENVTWSGQHRPPIENVTVHPRPMQQPRPPIWLGAGSSMESIDLAARLGLRLMLPTVFGTIDAFRPAVDRYIEQWDRSGHDPGLRRIGACHHCHVGRTTASARAAMEPRYRTYIEWVNELTAWSSNGRSPGLGAFDFDRLAATTAICGSPAEVIERMAKIRETLSLDTQILMFDFGGMPEDLLMETIALTGTEVLPAFS